MNKAIKRSLYVGLSLLMAASVAGPSAANAAHRYAHIHVNRRYVSRRGLLKDIVRNLRMGGKISADRKLSAPKRNRRARFYLNRAKRDYIRLRKLGYSKRALRSIKAVIYNNFKILNHPTKKVHLKKGTWKSTPVNSYFRLGSTSSIVSPSEPKVGHDGPNTTYVPYWFNFHVYRPGINGQSFLKDSGNPSSMTLGDVISDIPWLETGTSGSCPNGYAISNVYNPVSNGIDNPYQSDYKFVISHTGHPNKSRTLAVDVPTANLPNNQKFVNVNGQRENYLPLYGKYPEMIKDRNVNHYSNQDKWYHQGLYIGKLGHWEGYNGQPENYFLINMGDPGSDNWNSAHRPYKHIQNVDNNQHTYRITRNDYVYLSHHTNNLHISNADENPTDGIRGNNIQGSDPSYGHAHLGNYSNEANGYNY